MGDDFLFVYGTLLSGFDNMASRNLHEHVELVGISMLPGRLYLKRGWHFLYPIAEYDPKALTFIRGEVLAFKEKGDAAKLLEMLDRYEGVEYDSQNIQEYKRIQVPVPFKGEIYPCWFYNADIPPSGNPLLRSGDFRSYMEDRKTYTGI
jgi:gamma-glutamylcyclotransferase (GGCT)/AIG2-like uncharacterized protein YtfP